jgi:hypothetical protein
VTEPDRPGCSIARLGLTSSHSLRSNPWTPKDSKVVPRKQEVIDGFFAKKVDRIRDYGSWQSVILSTDRAKWIRLMTHLFHLSADWYLIEQDKETGQ